MAVQDAVSAGEPVSADVRRRYPRWQPYYGSPDQLCHARRAGTAHDVRGDSWQDVIDEIQRVEARIAVEARRDGQGPRP